MLPVMVDKCSMTAPKATRTLSRLEQRHFGSPVGCLDPRFLDEMHLAPWQAASNLMLVMRWTRTFTVRLTRLKSSDQQMLRFVEINKLKLNWKFQSEILSSSLSRKSPIERPEKKANNVQTLHGKNIVLKAHGSLWWPSPRRLYSMKLIDRQTANGTSSSAPEFRAVYQFPLRSDVITDVTRNFLVENVQTLQPQYSWLNGQKAKLYSRRGWPGFESGTATYRWRTRWNTFKISFWWPEESSLQNF